MTILMRTTSKENGTFGHMHLPDGTVICTVEQPWNDNKVGHSCIPAGTYTLRKRTSGVVERTTHGEFKEGWEVTDVPGRTYIMIHVANWPTDVEGCIGVGRQIIQLEGREAVSNSLNTFRKLMEKLSAKDEWTLVIERTGAEDQT